MTTVIRVPNERDFLRRVTRAAFFKRFTDGELEDIEFLCIDDVAQGAAIRRARARLRSVISILRSMEWVDLDGERVRAWVQLMESRSVIGAGRADEILDAAVQQFERP